VADARKTIDRLARQTVKAASAATDPLLGRLAGPRLLVYHQIDAGLGRQMEVTSGAFERQMEWLSANRTIVSLEEAWRRRAEPDSDRLAVLTFDDGYEDMYRLAYPILRGGGLPFTLYLTTHPTESGEPLLAGGRAEPIQWDQVEDMAESGLMTLGAHTHRHPDLRHVTQAEIEQDLDTSNELIDTRLGVVPRHFCYPYGFWSPQSDQPILDRYETAVLGSGPSFGADTAPHLIPRVPIQLSDGFVWFKAKVRSGLRLEDRLRRRLKRYEGP
jgi:peptidoglycan/xylan/chitin deacetylase (PgdA/CDA1 family)